MSILRCIKLADQVIMPNINQKKTLTFKHCFQTVCTSSKEIFKQVHILSGLDLDC